MTAAPLDGAAAWCLHFVERRCGDFASAALTDEGKPDEAEAAGAAVLSLAELDLAGDAHAAADHDHLAVLALRLCAAGAPDRLALRFLTSSAIRSASRAFGSRWLVSDLPVPTPAGLDEVALLVYRIRRTLRLERVVAAIEDLVEAHEAAGAAGDDDQLVLGRAALERLEVLDDAGEASVVVSGRGLRFADRGAGGRGDRYVAVVGAPPSGVEPLWLTERKLQEGPDRASARPVSGKPYALLRLGARSTRQSVREFIDEIRRRHQRPPGEAATDRGESFASFVDRQLDQRRRELIEATYGHHKMYPVVTPIALEAAANLEGTVAFGDDLPSRFKQLIESMRAVLDERFGVKIPGIRVRLNEADLPHGTYVILLDEVPLVSGNVDPGKLLCFVEPGRLREPPFDEWAGNAESHAPPDGSGRPACWIPAERSAEVLAAGLDALDAAGYLELHLRTVLINNLDMFATADDLAERLPREAGVRIRGAPGGLARFVEVARSLLLEALPIAPLDALAERYLALVDGDAVEIAEELRLLPAVQGPIRRDAASATLFVLGDACAARIRDGIRREGDAAVLALEPAPTQDLLSAVRSEVGAHVDGALQVLVVEDWRLRPFVRNLLVLEFPRVRVVARRELEGLALPPPTATIEVEP